MDDFQDDYEYQGSPGQGCTTGAPPLDSDYFQHQSALYTVDFADEFVRTATERGFSRKFTQSLFDIALGHFDKTHVLASLKDTEMSELYFDMAWLESLATADVVLDRNNTFLPEMKTIVRAMYMHYISRADSSKGPTERERQGRYTLYSEQRITNSLEQAKEQKRGLRLFKR